MLWLNSKKNITLNLKMKKYDIFKLINNIIKNE